MKPSTPAPRRAFAFAAGAMLAPIALIGLSAAPARMPARGACDRTCLTGALDRYLAGVIAHQPASAGLAPDYRATENAITTAAGMGIWQTATALGPVERRFADPVNGQAAYFGHLMEGDAQDIVSVRVKVAGGRISEAEWTIARKGQPGMMDAAGLIANPPPSVPVPLAERTPRNRMIAAADAYFQGLEEHDGARVPKVDGCERVENGVRVTHRKRPPPPLPSDPPPAGAGASMAPAGAAARMAPAGAAARMAPAGAAARMAAATASPGMPAAGAPGAAQEEMSGDCTAGFGGFSKTIAKASLRRYPLVDERAGIVLGNTVFLRPPGVTMRRNLLSEYFNIRGGKIAGIWAAMYYLDPAAPASSGW